MKKQQRGIDYSSPVYLQLREVIREKIESGEYAPGTAIPSENELARLYAINRMTVRSAVDNLVHEGLLKRIQGKGIYVTYGRMAQNLDDMAGFSPRMQARSARMGSRILKKGVRPARDKFSDLFGIAPQDDLFYARRVRVVQGEPVSLEELFIPLKLLPALEQTDLAVFSQYDLFEASGICVHRAVQTLDIVQLDPQEANLLGLENRRSVFLLSTTSYDENGHAIEYVQTYTRGDRCTFDVEYTRPDSEKQ